MNSVDLQVVKDTLLELDLIIDIEEQPEFYNTALVLLSAVICGPDTRNLAAFTGLSRSFIAPIRRRMLQSDLWTEIEACSGDWYVAQGLFCTTSFWLDVLVAQGLVVRTWSEPEGQYCYGLPERQDSQGTVN